MIVAGAENRPPMLDKSMYNSWQIRMLLYITGKKKGRMMLESIENGPLAIQLLKKMVKFETRNMLKSLNKKSFKMTVMFKQLTLFFKVFQDVYSLVNHYKAAKDIWDRVNLLMKGTELSYQERECKLYKEFDNKFVTDVKLEKNLYTTNYDQLYAYLSQHEGHANEARLLHERYPDPFALVANHQTQVTVQQVQGRQVQSFAGIGTKGNATSSRGNNVAGQARVVKCYNCQGEGHMSRQYTQPKRLRNFAWFKEKMLLVQTDDLYAYDSDSNDISSAKAILVANLSIYNSDVLSEQGDIIKKKESTLKNLLHWLHD
ncbi:retrovirus-related pol polyprotein from transposon TNT 1-94 [Tanacetum coccineum]